MATDEGAAGCSSVPTEMEQFSSLRFHQTLKRAGLTKERAAFQSRIGHLVEEVARDIVMISGDSYYDWMMTGSFVEGWGNNLFRLDGVTGTDSDIDWSQVVKHKVYHLEKTCKSIVDCINRKSYELKDGHIQVKNCSQQPAFDTKRHGLRPDTDECHAYPCCSYPKTVHSCLPAQCISEKFRKILCKQFNNDSPLEDVHFVRASVPGEVNQMRLSCTRQERVIMSKLTTVQGQLFTVLKYLLKSTTKFRKSKTARKSTNEKEDEEKQIVIKMLKSFHAKTLLMTLLREAECWSTSSQSGNPEEAEEAEAKQLHNLLRKAIQMLMASVDKSLSSFEEEKERKMTESVPGPSSESEAPRMRASSSSSEPGSAAHASMPRVLEHALLADAGLYLKVKAEPGGSLCEQHIIALRNLKPDLEWLLENLDCILLEYQGRIEQMLEKRGIPTARKSPNYAGQEPDFLFIPLLMLPRINLDTLLDEQKRLGERNRSATGDATEARPETPSRSDSATEAEQPQTRASEILKDAYINVWIVLKSLSAKAGTNDEDEGVLRKAWNVVSEQNCLKTTHLCLKIMKHLKEDNENKEGLANLLGESVTPKRLIKLDAELNYFDTLIRTEDCVWAFHYFTKPKEVLNYSYLDKVASSKMLAQAYQRAASDEEHTAYDYVWRENQDWLTHLRFRPDSKKGAILQPSLTVNFDGLLDSLRRCHGIRDPEDVNGSFICHMHNCLYDPRSRTAKEDRRRRELGRSSSTK